jgi:hypothetical protein
MQENEYDAFWYEMFLWFDAPTWYGDGNGYIDW